MRNVLFVAPYWLPTTRWFAAACGKLQNVRLLGICHFKPEGHSLEDTAHFQHLVQIQNCFDADELERAARGLEARYGKLHRVLGVLEQLQTTLAEVRDRMGVPGMDREAANRFYDKDVMKRALREAGLPTAKSAVLENAEQGRDFAKRVGYPIILKPPQGAGCKATYQISDAKQLETALAETRPSAVRRVQAEEFIQGQENSFETLCINGEPRFHSITNYYPSPLDAVRNEWIQWTCVLPRDISGKEYDDIRDIGFKTVKALGMKSGLTHMEWFRRPDGSIAIGEIAARPAGAQITRIMVYGYDVDMYRMWARAVVDEAFDGPYERKYAVGVVFLRGAGNGRVAAVEGLDEAQRKVGKYVVEANLPRVGAPKFDGYEGDGNVIVRHPKTETVMEILKTIMHTVKVRYTN